MNKYLGSYYKFKKNNVQRIKYHIVDFAKL